jgi:pimeloyl-ACP methyl ester carboxylesterase
MSPRRWPLLALALTLLAVPSAASAAVPAHGELISKQRVRGGSAPGGGATYVVRYSSKAPGGSNVVTSGLITVPAGKAPKGGFPVVSWAHGTTGIADVCAPSRMVGRAPSNPYVVDFRRQATTWVKAGWAVAQTDYQGLGTPGLHPYLIGESEGRSVIDIVSAARDLSGRVGRRWAAVGHSQGGHAVLWAAALAKGHAPTLKLTGAVPIAPASHIGEQAALIDDIEGNPFGGLPALIIAAGLQSAGIAPEVALSDRALALYPQIEQRCVAELSAPDSFGGLSLKEHFREGFDTSALVAEAERNDPENLTVTVPLLIAQGEKDTTVFPAFTQDTVDDLRGRGGKVTYRTFPEGTHAGILADARQATLAFLRKRLG